MSSNPAPLFIPNPLNRSSEWWDDELMVLRSTFTSDFRLHRTTSHVSSHKLWTLHRIKPQHLKQLSDPNQQRCGHHIFCRVFSFILFLTTTYTSSRFGRFKYHGGVSMHKNHNLNSAARRRHYVKIANRFSISH